MKEDNSLWDKYSIGDFAVWLFDYAETQDDERFEYCMSVYTDLIGKFMDEKE